MQMHLEQHRPGQNRFRFYSLEVVQDLFGRWCLLRRWGRIGTSGRVRCESFRSQAEAVSAAEGLQRRKARRGYALLPQQLDLPFGGL